MTYETTNVHYDTIELDEHREVQDEEISEPYYSEIAHNDSGDPRCIMKPNVCYNTLQASTVTSTGTANNGHGESGVCKPSVETATASDTAIEQNQSPDYVYVH